MNNTFYFEKPISIKDIEFFIPEFEIIIKNDLTHITHNNTTCYILPKRKGYLEGIYFLKNNNPLFILKRISYEFNINFITEKRYHKMKIDELVSINYNRSLCFDRSMDEFDNFMELIKLYKPT